MDPLEHNNDNNELEEAQAFAVKAVITLCVTIPALLICLHFAAAAMRLDFTIVKESELVLACIAVIALVTKFAFSKPKQ